MFPTTVVVVVVVLVAGVEPADEMATPLELLLILDDDVDEVVGGSALDERLLEVFGNVDPGGRGGGGGGGAFPV